MPNIHALMARRKELSDILSKALADERTGASRHGHSLISLPG